MVSFSLQNCREDGNWGKDATFPFTIDRDESFNELSIGEENNIKFNIVSDYDFSSIPIYVKFTNTSNGVLTLAGQELTPNQEYQLQNKNNIFKYIGNEQGTHKLKFYVRNSKEYTQEEEFKLPYAVSDFTHTKEGGNATIYQGDEINYTMKVVPNDANDTEGYKIRFNAPFNGEFIKLNQNEINIGEWYDIDNINQFVTTFKTNQAGSVSLNYSIKNNTVSHDYQIQQNVEQREIIVQSMTINTNAISVGGTLNLIGVIVQNPTTTNNNVEYKTWISSASNGNTAGISNTNNAYTSYTLGNGGTFNSNISAVQLGNYTYHIQFKDQYGNESEIKTFEIVVN